jgi:hypothetical protein
MARDWEKFGAEVQLRGVIERGDAGRFVISAGTYPDARPIIPGVKYAVIGNWDTGSIASATRAIGIGHNVRQLSGIVQARLPFH